MTTLTTSLRSRLLEALEPFRDLADKVLPTIPQDEKAYIGGGISRGDLRRLAALYDELKGGDASAGRNPSNAFNANPPPLASELAGANGALILSNEEFDAFLVMLETPPEPTAAILKGAEMLRQLLRKPQARKEGDDSDTTPGKDPHANPPPLASELAEASKALGDLLAIIHRDGGHYQAAHGNKAAVEAAHKIWADLQTRAEASTEPAGAMEERIAALTAELAEARRVIEPFAEIGQWMINENGWSDNDYLVLSHDEDVVFSHLQSGDFRRARAFLSSHPEKETK